MDAHGTDSGGIGAAPSVARLLLELRGRTSIDVRNVGRTLQVRPQGGTGVALSIHSRGVDIATAPEQADALALSMSGAYIKDPDDPNCFVVLEADLIDDNYDTLLDAAVQAVELRAASQPVKKAAAAKAPKSPKAPAAAKPAKSTAAVRPEPPRCPRCRQYELLASGECPSGYC